MRLEYVPVVRDFSDVFPNDILGLSLDWEIEFDVELVLKT